MAEVLIKFSVPVRGSDHKLYWSQACGGLADDGLWEGWLEFEGDRSVLRSARETEQPNRDDLMYWAQGLTMTYLQGSLERARQLRTASAERMGTTHSFNGKPRFDRPARSDVAVSRPAPAIEPRAILDPFAVFAEGEHLLRQQLNALSADQLRNIIQAYRLDAHVGKDVGRADVAEAIVRSVRSASKKAGKSAAEPEARG